MTLTIIRRKWAVLILIVWGELCPLFFHVSWEQMSITWCYQFTIRIVFVSIGTHFFHSFISFIYYNVWIECTVTVYCHLYAAPVCTILHYLACDRIKPYVDCECLLKKILMTVGSDRAELLTALDFDKKDNNMPNMYAPNSLGSRWTFVGFW